MRLNIFRNSRIDNIMSRRYDLMRKQTEGYWRIRIAAELKAQGYDTPALFVLGHGNDC
jgi:hypothetical protein